MNTYHFDTMPIGEIIILGSVEDATKIRQAVCQYVRRKAPEKKFSVIKQADGSYHFWRVK